MRLQDCSSNLDIYHAFMEIFPKFLWALFYFFIQVGKTLSERRWNAAFSKDGHLEIGGVLRRIQRGVKAFLFMHGPFLK